MFGKIQRDGWKWGEKWDGLFMFREASRRLAEIVGHWEILEKKASHVIDLYLGNLYAGSVPLVFWCFTYAQALESLHDALYEEKIEKEVHAEKLKSIMDVCPERHREWLAESLQYTGKKQYAERIRELVQSCAPFMFENEANMEEWIVDLKKMRNNIAHGKKGACENPHKIDRLASMARMLLDATILKHLEFPQEETLWCLMHHGDYNRFLRHLPEDAARDPKG